MSKTSRRFASFSACILIIVLSTSAFFTADSQANDYGVPGGLCVQIGCDDLSSAIALAKTDRFLVQAIDTNAAKVNAARTTLAEQDLYGLVSAIHVPTLERLPYADNLVNILTFDSSAEIPPASEIHRILAPQGICVVSASSFTEADSLMQAALELGMIDVQIVDGYVLTRKPRPDAMDDWPQPHYDAGANAVSSDTMVDVPYRVRWVTGPSVEINNMVTEDGRNYYGGVWSRDSYNGLRLWNADLNPTPARGGFGYAPRAGSVPPIAAGGRVYVLTEGAVRALDGRTGETVAEYPEAGVPNRLMFINGALLTADLSSVRLVDPTSGRLLWKTDVTNPQFVSASGGRIVFIEGDVRRGETLAASALDLETGERLWRMTDLDWLPLVRRIVTHEDLAVFEVSTLNDDKEGNAIHVVDAAEGELLYTRTYVPGMNHAKQARAFFINDALWILEDRLAVSLDPRTGEVKTTCATGFCHCFPPVATVNFMLAGEMDLTDLASGEHFANQLTKAACGRDAGWIPANGLIYAAPKHCVCWPMLRGYVAMAPDSRIEDVEAVLAERRFPLLRTEVPLPASLSRDGSALDWPTYRCDPHRSAAAGCAVPGSPEILWETNLGVRPETVLTSDWIENPFVHGPITPPVVADGRVCLARPDAHEVVSLDATSGDVLWRFTADGRIDSPPTLHAGLCLFGTKNGSVYCLRADDGRLVWRLRAAPSDEQIVAYGQLESPWPVPGSILVVDDVAYFCSGRQPLADGGILAFAVTPSTGEILWTSRLSELPPTNFYQCKALEFDNFDLMHQEGDDIAMSRWMFNRETGEITLKEAEAYIVHEDTDKGLGIIVPRGCWTYAPRNQPRHGGDVSPLRPLATFAGKTLFACTDDHGTFFRRDFDLQGADATFDTTWVTGWAASTNYRNHDGPYWRSDRLIPAAAWTTQPFDDIDSPGHTAAMVLADDQVLLAAAEGGLSAVSTADGSESWSLDVPPPVWDGLAVARGRCFLSTQDGRLICLGAPE